MINRNTHFLCLALCMLPFIYLATIWNSIPAIVPTHFGLNGVPDDYSGKNTLLAGRLLPAFIYLLMLAIPRIDPKNKLKNMAQNYDRVVLLLVLFMCILALFIIYSSAHGSLTNPRFIFIIIGGLFAAIGNYMPTMRPNYFIGVRTPWALENELVWRKTHFLSGRLWMIGGVLIILLALFPVPDKIYLVIFFAITILITLIPIIYSYLYFRNNVKGKEGIN